MPFCKSAITDTGTGGFRSHWHGLDKIYRFIICDAMIRIGRNRVVFLIKGDPQMGSRTPLRRRSRDQLV